LAWERNIDLGGVIGRGEFGNVMKADVEELPWGRRITSLARNVADYYKIDLSLLDESVIRKETVLRYAGAHSLPNGDDDSVVPLSAVRRVIAERMKQSMNIAPQYTIASEFDEGLLMERYESLRSDILTQAGIKLTFTDVLIKLAAFALGRHRLINASLVDDMIHYHKNINIGVAVAMSEGLIVPVIRNAWEKTLTQIARTRTELVDKAGAGRLEQQDFEGGTVTISNLGMYPVDLMTPIINQPESAIMGVGRVIKKPVVVDDAIVIRPMMNISVTADHRLIDGAILAEFMKTLYDCTENPNTFIEYEG
jgi:pyruvate dehydrogenase E2 component (dihydrolipoamide acetyltransferase)